VTRSRDIAAFLGKTEANNAQNLVLLNTSSVVGFDSAEVTSIAAPYGTQVFDSAQQLPLVGLIAGQRAFTTNTNRFYISNGSGWYSVATINATPTFSLSPDASYILASDGVTATTISILATDPEGFAITYSAIADSDFNGLATVSQDSSVFTITPKSQENATTSTGTLTFKATDGVNIASEISTFTLTFGPNWGIYEGSVRVYTRSGSTWTQQAKIQDNDQASNDRFGSGVDLNADATYLVVGKRLDDTLGDNAGNIFVFTRSGSTWTQQQAITATVSGTAAGDQIGWVTKINSAGDLIAAAAVFEENGGKVYTFTRSGSTWSQQQEFAGSDAVASDSFGIQLDINGAGDLMAVIGNASDSVYIFTKSGSTWTQQQQINKPGSGNLRSVSVSRNGDVIAITALDEATYVYQDVGGTWTLRKTLTPTGIASGDYYGEFSTHISQDGNWIAVGAAREDGPGNSVANAGKMFAYNVGS